MAIVFQDLFNDTPTTLLTAHSPDIGTGWTEDFTSTNIVTPNTMEIRSPGTTARTTNNLANARMATVTTDTISSADYQVTVNLATGIDDPDAPFFIVGRYIDSNNFYACGGYPANGGDIVSKGIILFKVRTGATEILGYNNDVGLTSGDKIRLVVSDEIKSMYLNGNLMLTSSDNSLTSAGHAGMIFGNWLSTFDDVDDDTQIADFTVDTTVTLEDVKPTVPLIRVSTGSDSQIQLFKWEGLNETNRGATLLSPRLTRKSIQVVGSFSGGLIRMDGSLIPTDIPDSFTGQFIPMEDHLGRAVSLTHNDVIDRINHAFSYRPVVVSGSGVNLTVFLLSVDGN